MSILQSYLSDAIESIGIDAEVIKYLYRDVSKVVVGLKVDNFSDYTKIISLAAMFAEQEDCGEMFLLSITGVELDNYGLNKIFYWKFEPYSEVTE